MEGEEMSSFTVSVRYEKSTDYTKTKLKMLRLEAKVRIIRFRIYDGT